MCLPSSTFRNDLSNPQVFTVCHPPCSDSAVMWGPLERQTLESLKQSQAGSPQAVTVYCPTLPGIHSLVPLRQSQLWTPPGSHSSAGTPRGQRQYSRDPRWRPKERGGGAPLLDTGRKSRDQQIISPEFIIATSEKNASAK